MKLCGFEVGLDKPLFVIAGPCVIESRQMALETAANSVRIAAGLMMFLPGVRQWFADGTGPAAAHASARP